MKTCFFIICLSMSLISCHNRKNTDTTNSISGERWSEQKINEWYQEQDWLIGANFVPSYAINQLEMWQAETFDINEIEKELKWANKLGFNTMRVFLHHLLWEQDSLDFIQRIDKYLEISEKNNIKTMFVLLDDVWNPLPEPGKQPEPRLNVHNSGWVQSPGRELLVDSTKWYIIEDYVKGIMTHFRDDHRVLIWDLYNEPGNTNGNSYNELEPVDKHKYSLSLLKKVYRWSRETDPSQPVCIDVWTSIGKELNEMSDIDEFAYSNSDVINIHCYANAEVTEKMIRRFLVANRPIFCTEYMARSVGSTFEEILPVLKKYNVAAYNWGFVSGKTQTIFPWDSWQKEYAKEPDLWFHDVLHKDGTPYKQEEVDLINRLVRKSEL